MDKNQIAMSHIVEIDVDMNDRLQDMVCDIGEDSFRKANVYDILCSDKDKLLYKGYTHSTRLLAVLKSFNLKAKSMWTGYNFHMA